MGIFPLYTYYNCLLVLTQLSLITIGGFHTTVTSSGTFFPEMRVIAPIVTWFPTEIEPRSVAPAPIVTWFPIVGCLLHFSLPVPPRVTPWNIVTLFPIIVVSPITTPIPWSIIIPLPIWAQGWISIPVIHRINWDTSLAMNLIWKR